MTWHHYTCLTRPINTDSINSSTRHYIWNCFTKKNIKRNTRHWRKKTCAFLFLNSRSNPKDLQILHKTLSSAKRGEGICELAILRIQWHINIARKEIIAIIVSSETFHQFLTSTLIGGGSAIFVCVFSLLTKGMCYNGHVSYHVWFLYHVYVDLFQYMPMIYKYNLH